MKRRLVLKRLLQTSGGLVATVLPGCTTHQHLQLLFPVEPQQFDKPLPKHVITPLSEFYVQSYASPPTVDQDKWQLKFTGLVDTPLTLTFEDILAAPQEDFYLTMECIGNRTGGQQIGNALWTGTPVLPFLKKIGIQDKAVEFVLHAADSYETTLPITDLMQSDVRLVHRMNGESLTRSHGFPLRIIIPGRYGQKQPKWLTEIEAIADPKQGYWERQGWSNTAKIDTHAITQQVQSQKVWNKLSQVNLPRTGKKGWQQGVIIAGVAIDQSQPMEWIKISTDNGKTWTHAEINQPSSPHEWTLWRYRWQPNQPGKYKLLAQAKSQRKEQPLNDKNARDGSAGVLKIEVTLLG